MPQVQELQYSSRNQYCSRGKSHRGRHCGCAFYIYVSNLHQHTLNRSPEATLFQDTDFLSEVSLLQNLRACKT